MKRRNFLKTLAGLPFLGFLKPKEGLTADKRSGVRFIGCKTIDWGGITVTGNPNDTFSFGDCVDSKLEENYPVTYFIDGKQVTLKQWRKHVWGTDWKEFEN